LEDGRLPHGALCSAANFFSVDITTISRLWARCEIDEAVNNQNSEQVDVETLLTDIKFFESGRKQSGRHMKWDVVAMNEAVRNLRLTERQNFCMLAQNIAVPVPTLHRMFKKGCFWHHTSPLKPFLTEENQVARVAYCLEEIYGATVVGEGSVHYKDMFDRVDIDKKWYYQTSDG
jgi:hypothetical protein